MIKTYAGIPYEEIVRRYADDITRLCVVWTQNEEAAKDCFQNTFLKLYMTKKSFREEEHIKAWLFKVARNECRDYHKQFWNRNVDIGYDPKQYERQRVLQVLVLYYYEEYNTSEIAKLLNVSVNTVKSRLRRGKEKLADILKED